MHAIEAFELRGLILMIAGFLIVTAALAWMMRLERRAAGEGPASPSLSLAPGLPALWLALLLGAIVAGLVLRLWGLDAKGLSHPEVYIPNIDLPEGISTPPPRHGLAETLGFHFFWEPHPFAYYLGMWAWTKAFGVSLFALRLPSALLGAASVYVIYRVGAAAATPRTGVLAAVLLACHGFHIYWSQMARMYVPAALLTLIATWLLLELMKRRGARPVLEGLYIATIALGTMTSEFVWVVLAVHMAWTALNIRSAQDGAARLAAVQAFAFIIATPMLAHAVMGGRDGATPPPTLAFLLHYFSFGFLLHDIRETSPAWAALASATLATALLLTAGLFGRTAPAGEGTAPRPSPWPRTVGALGAAAMILGVAAAAHDRKAVIAALAALPVLMLGAPAVMRGAGALAQRAPQGLVRRLASPAGLFALIAVAAPAGVFLLSFGVRLTAPQAFLLFTPYMVLLAAIGLSALASRRALAAAAGLVMVVLLGAGLAVQKAAPASPRDYQGLAVQLNAQMGPDDLIFTRPNSWIHTPIYYYLDARRLKAGDYAAALARAPRASVWVLSFDGDELAEALPALKDYRPVRRIGEPRARATLYRPPPP